MQPRCHAISLHLLTSFYHNPLFTLHPDMLSPMNIPQNDFNAHVAPYDYRGHSGLCGGYDALNRSGMPSSASYGETSYCMTRA